jgi:hypothetical protein
MSQISRKSCPFKNRKPPGYQAYLTKREPHYGYVIVKTIGTENKERILKDVREKKSNDI